MPTNPDPQVTSHRASIRLLLVAVLTLLVAGLAAWSAAPATSAGPADRPTIVLVHGAFSGPSAWDRVAARLRKDGYVTVTPALPLHAVAEDVATVRAALDAVPGPKVLVGHSYGGFVVSNASAGRSDVRALVYTAAFVPEQGETINDLGVGYALAASQIPTSLDLLFTPSGPVGWHAVPSWYAVSGADRIIDPDLQRAMAARAGSTVVTFDDASHAGGFTHYAARFVKLIEQAAGATG